MVRIARACRRPVATITIVMVANGRRHVGAVRSFGHSLNRAFTPPSRHLDNDHKIKSASSLGHSDIFESRHVQEPLNSQRRRRLRGKQIEAVLSHRYQNLVKMQW